MSENAHPSSIIPRVEIGEWPIVEAQCSDPSVNLKQQTSRDLKSIAVSVVIPVYNSADTIEWVLYGLLAQDYPPNRMQVIIADDGSHYDYQHLLTREWPWELLYVRQQDMGFRLGTVRNLGCQIAKGDLLVFIDGDTVPGATLISSHARWYCFHDRIAVIGPRRFIALPPGAPPSIPHEVLSLLKSQPRISSDANFSLLLDRRSTEIAHFKNHPFAFHLFHGCNASLFRAHWSAVGGFDPAFDGSWGYEDTEFAHRLDRSGIRFVADPSALVFHLETSASSERSRANEELRNFNLACQKIRGFRKFKVRLRRRRRNPWW